MHVEIRILNLILIVATSVIYYRRRIGKRKGIVIAIEPLTERTKQQIILREQARESTNVLVILIRRNQR